MNSDFKEMLEALNAFHVRYLIVGAYAVMKYTEPRYTKDLDILIATDRKNAEHVFKALAHFGAPIADYSPEDFKKEGFWFQVGVPPVRIDILLSIPGVEFETAWPNRVESVFMGVPAHYISREDLIAAKQATGRRLDKLDVKQLQTRYRTIEEIEQDRGKPGP